MGHFKEFAFKKFGIFDLSKASPGPPADHNPDGSIKVAFIKAGGRATIDFKDYLLKQDALFFINAGQYHRFDEDCSGTVVYYNRDFYCVEIHDKEVACDGILFHNIYEIPVILLSPRESAAMQVIIGEMKAEFSTDLSSMEEMLRILLKQLIIRSTRIWKRKHDVTDAEARGDLEFSRAFSQLVEWHYTRHHTVAEYAALLNISPKALNKRIKRKSSLSPNDLIKQRIILEAKRLLVHTSLSVKEIAYKLGYDDPSYFIRLFTSQAGAPPQHFRMQYQQAE